ncbi:MAG TPA: AAA family ATPase [Chloroflexota bacterium]|nr:AAA family ATPase [Chloroflexota bacterium]
MAIAALPSLPGLDVMEVLDDGSFSTLFRACSGEQRYALKVLKPDIVQQRPDWAKSARNRAGLAATVNHAGLPTVVRIGEVDGAPYIVTEVVDGETLAARLRAGPRSEAEVVQMAGGLAEALAELHRHGLVHRNVKPENIVCRAGAPVLMDFDFVEVEPAERARADIVTLMYAAPELHGLIQRPVDGRADLYSLGAVLFECLAGRPLFSANSAAELTRQHAFTPVPIQRLKLGISDGLAAILTKPLAKEPENRYQSAAGLLHDLNLLPTLNVLLQEGRQISLGADDLRMGSASNAGSTARASEIDALRQQWQAAAGEAGRVIILTGPAGSGKSVLAGKLAGELGGQGKLVLIGETAGQQATPFGVLRLALDQWLAALRMQPALQRERDEQRIRIAAADYGGVLGVLAPQIAAICKSEPSSAGSLASERFVDIVAEFLVRLAGCFGGMLLLLDDIDRADSSTRAVLERLAHQVEQAPILLLLAIRATTRTAKDVREWRQALDSADPQVLWLGPLSIASIKQVIADELGGREVGPKLHEHVASWTSGNPLAVSEYSKVLLEAGVLTLEWGRWTLDAERLQHIELPADVAQLIGRRIDQLDAASRQILQFAALVGAQADTTLLEALSGHADTVATALAAAARAELIRPDRAGACVFSHERVREALMGELNEAELAKMHLRIADLLERLGSDDEQGLYSRARHLSLAGTLSDPQRVYECNKLAGSVAMGQHANAEAYEFFAVARGAAEGHRADIDVDLEAKIGLVCARTGRWTEAVTHLGAAIDHAADEGERARLRAELARVHLANRETVLAWSEINGALRELGTPMGHSALAAGLYSMWCWLIGLLCLSVRAGYGYIKGNPRRRLELLSELYVTGAYISYFLHAPWQLANMVVRLLYAGHLLGDSVAQVSAYTAYANVLAILGRRRAASKFSERSIALARKLGDRFQLARMRMFQAWQAHVSGDPRLGAQLMRECLRVDGTWLDAADFTFAHIDLAWNLMMRGYCREALQLLDRAAERAYPGGGDAFNLNTKAAALLAVLGEEDAVNSKLAQLEVQAALTDSPWQRQGYLDHLLLVHYERGEYALGGKLLEDYASLAPAARRAAFHSKHLFVFQAYVRLGQLQANKTDPAGKAAMRGALSQLRQAGDHPTLRAHYLVLSAALLRHQGQIGKAMKMLQAGQELANEADNPWALFEAHRQVAHCLAELGNPEAAVREARLAHRLAIEFGWVHRARQLRAEFQGLRAPVEQQTPPSGVTGEGLARQAQSYIDALLQVSAAASSTLDPHEQARLTLDEIVRLMKADRGFLFGSLADGEVLLRAARNADGEDIEQLAGYSRVVVETVRASGEPMLVTSAASAETSASNKVVAEQPRSILAAPLIIRGRLLGIVYVDSQIDQFVWGDAQLRVLSAIAGQIAVAFDASAMVAEQRTLARANTDLMDALRLRISELQESGERIIAAEERLRRDIAEMLHSRVQSQLLVAAQRLGRARELTTTAPDDARRAIQEVEAQLDDIRDREVREASHLLHPSFIRRGLGLALETLIGRFEEAFQVEVEIDPAVAELDTLVGNQLPEPVRLTAYRGIEEALGNAQRHAKASAVNVQLSLTGQRELQVTVTDNGRGFEPDKLQPGLGLSSIAGRVNQLGGSWNIDSRLGQGAELTLLLPLAS